MTRVILRVFVALILIVAGWSVGLAQGNRPAFHLTVTSGTGFATVKCASGCLLTFLNQEGRPTASNDFTLECEGARPCQSTLVGGFVQP